MDDPRFDALTRFVATPRSRRQVAKALGGGTLAAVVAAFGSGRAGAAECASGVVCSGQCCPEASDICLRDRCTSCPSGVLCRDRCCNAGQQCLDGRCTGCATGIICGDACCAAGDSCVDGRCRTAHQQPPPTVNPGPNPPPPCPPGYRECDGVCYPGGCCVDADCGDPCLVCDTTSHVCQGCSADQICQPGRGCCTPVACQSGQCGSLDDGCGGRLDCGDCPAGQTCQNGACVPNCMPDCTGKSCGDDGCGGSCGSCDASQCQTCDASRHTCGPACADGEVCHQGTCCTPDCTGTRCGDDGCGGTCHTCPAGQTCHQGSCCTPHCAGKTCGDDGCGGSCGTCPTGQACLQGPQWGIMEGQCCLPNTCDFYPKQCGRIPDGCGGTLDCQCPAGEACPDESKLSLCCTPEDKPTTCAGKCGTVLNNCGQSVDCGDPCDHGKCETCGANHTCESACGGGRICLNGGCFRVIPSEDDCDLGACTGRECGGQGCIDTIDGSGGQLLCAHPLTFITCGSNADCPAGQACWTMLGTCVAPC